MLLKKNYQKVLNGLGIALISTSKGKNNKNRQRSKTRRSWRRSIKIMYGKQQYL